MQSPARLARSAWTSGGLVNDAIVIGTIFLGMASVVALPLSVLLGLPLAAWLARSWLRIEERKLDLRRLEVATRLRESRLLPSYVDANDPEALIAWARADGELAGLELRR
jgi:hypothetical protein